MVLLVVSGLSVISIGGDGSVIQMVLGLPEGLKIHRNTVGDIVASMEMVIIIGIVSVVGVLVKCDAHVSITGCCTMIQLVSRSGDCKIRIKNKIS
jgi:hypothetical protein